MRCPKCKMGMKLVETSVSVNYHASPQKAYDKKLYVCEEDDIWVQVEEPKKMVA